jgi:glycine oxidase
MTCAEEEANMNQTADIVIVGGGVIGCFIAYELSKAGLEVVVVEKSQIGAEASSAAAGLLVPLHVAEDERTPLFDLYLESTRMFPAFVPELEEETGIRLEYAPTGILRISLSKAEETAVFSQFQKWQNTMGMSLTWLNKAEVHDLEPELAETVCGSILSHDEGSINNARLVLALARAAANQNARFLEGCLATGVQRTDSRFSSLKTTEGEISAEHLVVATGAWSGTFCEALDISIPITPARGQMLAVTTIQRLVQRPINSSSGGIFPKADGSVYVGATVEQVGFDKRNTPEGIAGLLEMGSALVPRLRQGRIERSWSGLRPCCEDGLPVIGHLPGWDNVAVATGHFKMGICGSPITAKLIHALIVERQFDPAMEVFSPARFV